MDDPLWRGSTHQQQGMSFQTLSFSRMALARQAGAARAAIAHRAAKAEAEAAEAEARAAEAEGEAEAAKAKAAKAEAALVAPQKYSAEIHQEMVLRMENERKTGEARAAAEAAAAAAAVPLYIAKPIDYHGDRGAAPLLVHAAEPKADALKRMHVWAGLEEELLQIEVQLNNTSALCGAP